MVLRVLRALDPTLDIQRLTAQLLPFRITALSYQDVCQVAS